MTTETRKPLWPMIVATVVVVMAVVYPLSYGPAWWLRQKGLVPEFLDGPLDSIYGPLVQALWSAPKPIDDAFRWYVHLWWVSPP